MFLGTILAKSIDPFSFGSSQSVGEFVRISGVSTASEADINVPPVVFSLISNKSCGKFPGRPEVRNDCRIAATEKWVSQKMDCI